MIYGARFKRMFTSPQAITASQLEWEDRIEFLSFESIDQGMEKLKNKMEVSQEYHWPDIALTIKLCRQNEEKAKLRLCSFKPAPILELTDEERAKRAKEVSLMLNKEKRKANTRRDKPNNIDTV